MKRDELEKLVDRLLVFLILDFAVNSIRVEQRMRLTQAPPTHEQVTEWLRVRLDAAQIPSVPELARFLSAYHMYSGIPNRSSGIRPAGGCSFPSGCPYSDLDAALVVGASIEMDHILPQSRGGSSFPWQFQPLCRAHNLLKGNAIFWDPVLLPLRGWCEDG